MQKVFQKNLLISAGRLIVGVVFLLLFFGIVFQPTTISAQSNSAGSDNSAAGSAGGVTDFSGGGFTACNLTPSQVQGEAGSKALETCIRSVMQFALVIGGIVAMFQLALAAFNYYNPEVNTNVLQSSIDTIRNVFIGLMLIAGPVMFLGTFNTSLLNLRFLGFTSTDGSAGSSGTSSGTGSGSNSGSPEKKAKEDSNGNITVDTSTPENTVQSLQDLIDLCKDPSGTKLSRCTAAVTSVLNAVQSNIANITKSQKQSLQSSIDTLRKQGLSISQETESKIMNGIDENNNFRASSLNLKDGTSITVTAPKTTKLYEVVGGKLVIHLNLKYVNQKNQTVSTKLDIITTFNNLAQLVQDLPDYFKSFLEVSKNASGKEVITVKNNATLNVAQLNNVCNRSKQCTTPAQQ